MVRFGLATWLLLALCAITSLRTQAQTPAPPAAEPSVEPASPPSNASLQRTAVNFQTLMQKRQQLLADSLGAQAVWLDDTKHMLAFWYPHLAATSRGTLLIAHDTAPSSVWPDLLDNLVHHLPKHGWSLLTVALPETFRAASSPTADSHVDPMPETPPTTDDLLTAATRYLADRGISNIILAGEGRGAADVWTLVLSRKLPLPVDAIVLINSPSANLIDPVVPVSTAPVKEIPTLDLYIDDFQRANVNAEARRRNMLQSENTVYQQRRLAAVTFTGDQKAENRVTKFVRGFITNAVDSP